MESAAETEGSPGSNEHERILLARVQNGDVTALADLITLYLDAVTRFAFYIVGSYDVAEDIAQDVFIMLWDRRDTLTDVRSLKPYLFRAVRNRAFDERKANAVRDRHRQAIQNDVSVSTVKGNIANPEDAWLTTEAIKAAMRELPERRRLVLRLRIEDQLTYPEIADIMGLTPDAVRVLANRAALELRKKLGVFG